MNNKKFPPLVNKFKGIYKFNVDNNYFNLYIDKNNSLYDITNLEVLSWKVIKGKRKVPDKIVETRNREWFNKFYGQPRAIVERKIELMCSFI